MLQLSDRFSFNLPDALTRYMEIFPYFFERATLAIVEAIAQPHNLALLRGQAVKHVLNLLSKQLMSSSLCRCQSGVIFNEVTHFSLAVFSGGRFQTYWFFLGILDDVLYLASGHPHRLGNLFDGWFMAKILEESATCAEEKTNLLPHVDGKTNGFGLVGNGPRDGLANPPGRIGAKLVAFGIVELFDRSHEADVSFLDQVQQIHTTVTVLFRDAHDKAKVRFG